jgi:hypothetical protein
MKGTWDIMSTRCNGNGSSNPKDARQAGILEPVWEDLHKLTTGFVDPDLGKE